MIHKYQLFGHNIVIDVNSGSIHIVDDLGYALMDFDIETADAPSEDVYAGVEGYTQAEIDEAFSELKTLQKDGKLFSGDSVSLEAVERMRADPPVKALCLHVCHDCNLRCKYCFASTGAFSGERLMMSAKVGRAAIDFVIRKSRGRRNIEIDFFGGEPLMNFEVVKDIVTYATEKGKEHNKNFRFTLTTNGILINDDIIEYLNENMSNIVLSLDGTRETNDYLRPGRDKRGSYDSIIEPYKKIAKLRDQDNYYIRGTYTAYNPNFSKDIFHIADEGFLQTSMEPVVLKDSHPLSIKAEHLEIIMREYEIVAKEYIKRRLDGRGFNFFHFMLDLQQGPCVIKRIAGCGAGSEYLAVTPTGDIYPCHRFAGESDYKMGSVLDHGADIKTGLKEQFLRSNVYTKEECRQCFAKFYCGGGCHANNILYGGGIDKPYEIGCALMRKRVECAIAIKACLRG